MKCFENVGAFTHEEQRSERHFYMPAKQFLALDLFCAGIGNAVFRVPAFHKQASKPTASASTFRLTRPAGGDPKTSAHLTNIKGETTMKFNTAFRSADILLPADANMTKWAVVACDQYTSEPEYWAKAEEVVGDAPSALRLVLPEIYLEQEGVEARIAKINEDMWCELFLLNKTELLAQMDLFMDKFKELKESIESSDTEKIKSIMRTSTQRRRYFDKK